MEASNIEATLSEILQLIWRPTRKSELIPKAIKTRVIRYAIIQSRQWVLELTHSSLEGSI